MPVSYTHLDVYKRQDFATTSDVNQWYYLYVKKDCSRIQHVRKEIYARIVLCASYVYICILLKSTLNTCKCMHVLDFRDHTVVIIHNCSSSNGSYTGTFHEACCSEKQGKRD